MRGMWFVVLIEFQVLFAAAPVLCCFRSSTSTSPKAKVVPLAVSPIAKLREDYQQSLKRWGQPNTSILGTQAQGRTLSPKCTVCGYRGETEVVNEIIGGGTAPERFYPWQVYVRSDQNVCGGVLIAPQWVLTAAHCISTVKLIILGTSNIDKLPREAVTRESDKVIVHEKYRSIYDDIALIKLDKPVNFNSNIRPICLPTGNEDFRISNGCYLTGWGNTDSVSKKPATLLQEIKVRIMSHTECFTRWGYSNKVITLGHLCTEFDQSKRNAGVCFGDSGGPLACRVGDLFYLAGIASNVESECHKMYLPDLFTRVSYYRKWIANNILETGSN
ncbi:hypothetical protein BsWGS_25270 [Bradybaena similaris]